MIGIEDIIKKYADDLYVARIIESYGSRGEDILKLLTQSLRDIYTIIDVRKFELIYVINSFDNTANLTAGKPFELKELITWCEKSIVIELTGSNFLITNANGFNPETICDKAIIYKFKKNIESFYMIDGQQDVLTQLEGHDSYFLKPSYKELDEALSQYRRREARTSSCLILRNNAWTNDNRVVLVSSPEHILRDSLFQFLKNNLRNYREVLREQNMDERKPIDIKITWNYSNRVALIEVKWIGMSASGNSYVAGKAAKRVNEGAEQLVEYLNFFNTEAPDQNTRGYLVTFDARRKRVNKSSVEIDCRNGFIFKNDDIILNPDYPNLRNDFEPHIQIFLEPKCLS